MSVVKAALPLCIFGFFSEVFPLAQLLSIHLINVRNEGITRNDNDHITAFENYSVSVILILIVLLVDLLRYKTVLILKAESAILLWCFFRWTTSVGVAEFALVVYAFYYSCDVAYVSYIFDKVSSDHFLTATSFSHAAPLMGRFINVLLFTVINIEHNVHLYLGLAAQIVALLIAVIFLNFNRIQSSSTSLQRAPQNMITHVQTAISNQHVVFYSIWYIAGFGVFYFFIENEQIHMLIFHNIRNEMSWNGFFTAIALGLSIFCVMPSPRMAFIIQHKENTLTFLAAIPFLSSVIIFLFGNIEYRLIKYICFWSSHIIFYTSITISSAEIARGIPHGSYGLVFGINTYLAVCVRVILSKFFEVLQFSENTIYNLMGGVMVFVGLTYVLFMVMCNVRTSNPGIVLSRNTGSNI